MAGYQSSAHQATAAILCIQHGLVHSAVCHALHGCQVLLEPYALVGLGCSCSAQSHRVKQAPHEALTSRQHACAGSHHLFRHCCCCRRNDSINTTALEESQSLTIPIMCGYTYGGSYGRSFVSADVPAEAIKSGMQGKC
jgi:hypothetical protein